MSYRVKNIAQYIALQSYGECGCDVMCQSVEKLSGMIHFFNRYSSFQKLIN